ncbi:MAG: oligosaccharide flippase family protein [Cyanobacteria bacterium P01_F01_bin.4]
MQVAKDLRQKVMKGGIYLTLRQLFSAVISLISVLIIARILGPENYGIVAIAMGIFYFSIWTSKLGLNVYLIRQPELPEDSAEQILAFLVMIAGILCGALWLAAPAFGWWTGRSEIADVVRWLTLPIGLEMIARVSIAMLERDLRFAEVGMIEAVAQAANYLLAVPLVLMQWRYWGPIAGLVMQFLVLLLLARRAYPIGWRWRWRWQSLKPALQYGLTYSASDWIFCFKALTVPLVVSRLGGIETAGFVSIAIRLVEQLGMLRIVIRRMSISVMAKLMDDVDATRRAISQGMTYQAFLIGPVCALFACSAAWVIPTLFGEKWLPSIQVFPLIAIATLVSAVFDLHAAALYATGHNRDVALQNLLHIGLLWLGCYLFLPSLGLWGYGVAELLTIPSYLLIHHTLIKLFGLPNYRGALWLIVATVPPLLGSVFLPFGYGIGLLILSYGLLFLINTQVRQTPLELIATWRAR